MPGLSWLNTPTTVWVNFVPKLSWLDAPTTVEVHFVPGLSWLNTPTTVWVHFVPMLSWLKAKKAKSIILPSEKKLKKHNPVNPKQEEE